VNLVHLNENYNEEFEDWFYGVEGWHIVAERFWDDYDRGDKEQVRDWIHAAFTVGYVAGRNSRD
jgi:hypothetical protein